MLAWPRAPYMSKPDVFPSGVIDLHRGQEEQGVGGAGGGRFPWGSWAWVE